MLNIDPPGPSWDSWIRCYNGITADPRIPSDLPEVLAPHPTQTGFLDPLLQWYSRRENPALLWETCLLIASCKFYVLTIIGLSASENEELRSRARTTEYKNVIQNR